MLFNGLGQFSYHLHSIYSQIGHNWDQIIKTHDDSRIVTI